MITLDGEALRLDGAMTMSTARRLDEAASPLLSRVRRIDLAAVSEVDSSAIALLFGWMRTADRPLALLSPPASLKTLAEVYGVAELLGLDGQR